MLSAAFGWLDQLAQFVGALFPRLLVVKTSDRVLKYVRGRTQVLLEPGLHVYWPLVTELEACCVVRQVVVHKPHVLETADGVQVIAAGITSYRIVDPVQFLAENEDPYSTIDDVVAAAIRQVVVSRDYDVLGDALPETDAELTAASRRLLRPFGVRVEHTRLTDFARTRTVHLTGGVLPHAA
jgi:regulator of protease activity HflC (stomatin/prohibitin superfamily)